MAGETFSWYPFALVYEEMFGADQGILKWFPIAQDSLWKEDHIDFPKGVNFFPYNPSDNTTIEIITPGYLLDGKVIPLGGENKRVPGDACECRS